MAFKFNPITGLLDVVVDKHSKLKGLSANDHNQYLLTNCSNDPLTGNLEVLKADPEIKLTDIGDSNNTRLIRTDTNAQANRYNTVAQPGGGNALDFDGNDDCVNVGNDSSLFPTTGLTWAVWANANADGSTDAVMAIDSTVDGSPAIYIINNSGTWQTKIRDSGGNNFINGNAVSIGAWVHLVLTWDGSNFIFYNDGASVGTPLSGIETPIYDTSEDFVIGCLSFNNGGTATSFFDGKIDEVAIWSETLSANDVSDLYNSGSGFYIDKDINWPTDGGSMGTNLEALWHHDETAMNQAPGGLDTEDSSVNSNHGTAEVSMTSADFVAGKVPAAGSDQEVVIWQSEDGSLAFEKGKQSYGDPNGRTILCGKTLRFNIINNEKAQMNASGTLIIDNGAPTAQALILKGAVLQSESLFILVDSLNNRYIDSGNGLTSSEFVGNQQGLDIDLRWEGSNEDKLLLLDAENNEVRVGDGDTNYFTTDRNGDSWWVGGGGLVSGHMYIDGTQAIVVAITQNVPAEVEDDGTTSAEDGWLAGELNLVTFPTGGTEHYLTVPKAGKYKVIWDMSFSMAAPGATVEIHGGVMLNGTAIRDKGETHRTIPNTTASGNMGAPMVLDAPAGTEQVSLWIMNTTNNNDITAEHGNVYLELIGGT